MMRVHTSNYQVVGFTDPDVDGPEVGGNIAYREEITFSELKPITE